ncbi:hypothetical protein JCM8097_006329 [Rhodosporidiobolus ruineniae]
MAPLPLVPRATGTPFINAPSTVFLSTDSVLCPPSLLTWGGWTASVNLTALYINGTTVPVQSGLTSYNIRLAGEADFQFQFDTLLLQDSLFPGEGESVIFQAEDEDGVSVKSKPVEVRYGTADENGSRSSRIGIFWQLPTFVCFFLLFFLYIGLADELRTIAASARTASGASTAGDAAPPPSVPAAPAAAVVFDASATQTRSAEDSYSSASTPSSPRTSGDYRTDSASEHTSGSSQEEEEDGDVSTEDFNDIELQELLDEAEREKRNREKQAQEA